MSIVNIVPYPKQGVLADGKYIITNTTNIYCCSKCSELADDLMLTIRRYHTAFYGKINVLDLLDFNNNDRIEEISHNAILMVYSYDLPEEGYSIDINTNGIIIKSSSYKGFYYGYNTLIRFFPNDNRTAPELPCIRIEDYPNYSWRGVLIDVARHFFNKNEIMRLIDLLGASKINKLHLHLSDDQGFRIQSNKFPQLCNIGSHRNDSQTGGIKSKKYCGIGHHGYYTQDDIMEIVAYGDKKAVEIIPGFEFPCHCTAMIASYPQLSCRNEKVAVATSFGEFDNSICLGKDANMLFITDLLDELLPLFSSRYYHLGGSGIDTSNWSNCKQCKQKISELKLSNERELLAHMYNVINRRYNKDNLSMILFDTAYSKSLDSDIIIQCCSANLNKNTIETMGNGRQIIISSSDKYSFNYPYSIIPLKRTYCTPILPKKLSASANIQIMGVEAILWTEWIYDREKLDFNLFPRINAVSEKCWSDKRDYTDFIERCRSYFDNIDPNAINFARQANKRLSVLRRIKESHLWHTEDQYYEVRNNRKLNIFGNKINH